MPTYLERYLAGEREQVWSEMFTLGTSIVDDELGYLDVKSVANLTMHRVRHNIQLIVRRLDEEGYWFASHPNRAYCPPNYNLISFIDRFEQEYGQLPISLRAWYVIVGEANLTGTHPSWMVCTDTYTCDKPLLAGTLLLNNIKDIIDHAEKDTDLTTWLREFSRGTMIDASLHPERISKIVEIATSFNTNKDAKNHQLQKYLASVTPLKASIIAPLRRLPPFFRFTSDDRQIIEVDPIYFFRPSDPPSQSTLIG